MVLNVEANRLGASLIDMLRCTTGVAPFFLRSDPPFFAISQDLLFQSQTPSSPCITSFHFLRFFWHSSFGEKRFFGITTLQYQRFFWDHCLRGEHCSRGVRPGVSSSYHRRKECSQMSGIEPFSSFSQISLSMMEIHNSCCRFFGSHR